MRNARIGVIGCTGLGNEVLKNIVLAGVGAIHLLDNQMVKEKDLGTQFLLSQQDIGKNRAEAALSRLTLLNPRVQLITFKKLDDDFYNNLDIICVLEGTPQERVN